ncbi:MAG: response regulator [Nitrospinota bacterium]
MARKIMVVDDERSVCRALRKFLERKGYRVVEAYNGHEALELYKRERPKVVLLDIRMPGKNGLEVLRELKAHNPKARVIMVSAVQEEEIVLKAMNAGAFDYITKPINRDHLETALMNEDALLSDEEH